MNHTESLNDEYYIKRLCAENLSDLVYLVKDSYLTQKVNWSKPAEVIAYLKNIYNRDISIESFQKKYNTAIFGGQYIGYIAYATATDEPAAYYGMFPVKITYQGQTYLCAQSGDTMTHSNHRRKGLFKLVALKANELAKHEGIRCVFGFPVEASFYGFKKYLAWQFCEKIHSYNFLVFTFPMAHLLKKISETAFNIHRKYVYALLNLFSTKEPFVYSSIEKGYAQINRDADYFHYKDNSNKFVMTLNTASMWFSYDGTFAIGDIVFEDERDVKKIIRKLSLIAFACGVLRIRFYTSPNIAIDTLLQQHYPFREGLNIGYLDFDSNIPIEKLKFTFADFDTF